MHEKLNFMMSSWIRRRIMFGCSLGLYSFGFCKFSLLFSIYYICTSASA